MILFLGKKFVNFGLFFLILFFVGIKCSVFGFTGGIIRLKVWVWVGRI